MYDLFKGRSTSDVTIVRKTVSHTRKDLQKWTPVTLEDFDLATTIVSYFITHKLGLKKGDILIVLARSSYWSLVLEFSCYRCGVIVAPIYETASSTQISSLMKRTGSVHVFLDSERHRSNVPKAAKVVSEQNLVEAVRDGEDPVFLKKCQANLEKNAPKPDDVAAIMLSAGMDGTRVGVQYTHSDIIKNTLAVTKRLQESKVDMSRVLNLLSFANIAPKIFLYSAIYQGSTVGIAPGVREVLIDIHDFKPTFIVAVPRVFDRIYTSLLEGNNNFDVQLNSVYDMIYKIFRVFGYNPPWQRALIRRTMHRKPSKRFCRRLRQMLGGNLRVAISTALKPNEQLMNFFNNIGVHTYDCYSVTELKGVVSLGTPLENKPGTVGKPLQEFDVTIEDDTIHVNGEKTGDLGELDDDGFLTIKGRDKDLIIISSGRRVLPEPIQQAIDVDPLIEDTLIIGEHRPYISAFIALDEENLKHTLDEAGIEMGSVEASVFVDKRVHRVIEDVNKHLPDEERIKRYLILEDGFTKDTKFVSGSMRLKRDALCKHYKDLINGVLYA